MAIVYEHLRNDTNEVFYVGISKTTRRAFDRNGRNPHWYNIVNKVGYSVNIIHKDIDYKEAKNIEILLIEKYGRNNLGLGNLVNMTDGGEGCLGVIVSEDTRQKMSKARKGKPLSEETRVKMSEANKGKTLSEDTRKKISEAGKGRIVSEETRHKIGKKHKGKILTEEIREKISKKHIGKTHSEETRVKMSEGRIGDKNNFFGKNHTEEARKKMSKVHKGKILTEETKLKMSKAKRNTKDVKGYYFHKSTKKYLSRILVGVKHIYLGSFDAPEEASEAYQKARLIYFV